MRSSLFTMRFRRICVIVSRLANWHDNPFPPAFRIRIPTAACFEQAGCRWPLSSCAGTGSRPQELGAEKGSGIFYKIVKIFLDNPLTHTEVLLYDNGASEKAHSAMMHEIAR